HRPPPVPGTHSMNLRPSTPPQCVPLPSPPPSSLPDGPDPESDSLRAAIPTITCFLATAVTDPLFESTAASALVAELVDFAAACRLDYATADPSLFLRNDTTLPPFYVLVYVDDLVFASADTEALAHVKSELAQHTITLTQSHMVQQVLQRFGFTYSSPQSTPLPTGHSISAPPSDESVEPSGPYPELVGCLIYNVLTSGAGGAAATGPGGARTQGTRAAGTGGVEGAGVVGPGAGGAEAVGAGVGGTGAGAIGAVDPCAGGTVRPRPYFNFFASAGSWYPVFYWPYSSPISST
ncbi:unnamed protein product, partial [Closterium sp. NIES-53]